MDAISRRRPGLGRGLRLALLAAALGLPARPGAPDDAVPGPVLKAALQRYRDVVARLRWASSDGNIVALYAQALAFGPRRSPELAADTDAYLSQCTEAQKTALKEALPGLEVGESGSVPRPDLPSFLRESKKSKTQESHDFFELMQRVHPGHFGLVYRKGSADEGCTLFGSGIPTDVYAWLRAAENDRKMHHYRQVLESEAGAVLHELLASPCACGGAEDVERELRRFLKAFPNDPAMRQVQARLAEIRGAPGSLELHCTHRANP